MKIGNEVSFIHEMIIDSYQLKQPSQDDKRIVAIKDAISQVKNDHKEYSPTKEQLKEYPWLENASYGIRKVSDIIEDFENGIDGSGDFSITSISQDRFLREDKNGRRTHAYTIYAESTRTTTHLAYDDENFTREGKSHTSGLDFHVHYYETEVNDFKEIQLSIDVKNVDKDVNFENLYEKLRNDKGFEKEFISSMENHLYHNDSSKLLNDLKESLDIKEAEFTLKDPASGGFYTTYGTLDLNRDSNKLNILA